MQKGFTRDLGRSGIHVSAMGLGCWAIGGMFNYLGLPDGYGDVDDNESIRAIHKALELGITFFDTSDAYGTGHSEEVLGKALKGRRQDVIIATKFGNVINEATREITAEDCSPEYIRRACEASLRRLGTDYIDLYQLHLWSIPDEKIEPLIDVLDELKAKGLIRSYGWSTDKADSVAVFAEKSDCTAIQQSMNIFGYEKEVLEICERYGLASINRSPLAMGLLSGKFNADTIFSSNDVRGNKHEWLTYFENGKPVKEFLDKVDDVKEILRSDGRSLVQGSLAWIWAKSQNTVPIPGFRNVRQVEENAGAMEFGPLTQQQMEEIDKILGN